MTVARNFLASLSKRSNAEKEIPRFAIRPGRQPERKTRARSARNDKEGEVVR
jgi:hypothetical protein